MKSISYFGVKRSGLTMKCTLTRLLDEPTAHESGILVPTSAKNAVNVMWGDVVVCVGEALKVSPKMRADLREMLNELELEEIRGERRIVKGAE